MDSKVKKSALSGIISGSLTAVIFQPLEFIKTKQQQPSEFDQIENFKYQNRTIREIIHRTLRDAQTNELRFSNLTKFWTGLTPSLYRSIPVSAIYFSCIESFRNSHLVNNLNFFREHKFIKSFVIASLAKGIADITVFPLNIIKTRYESDFYNYKNLSSAFTSILRKEGVRGLYKGLSPTLVRDIGYSGMYYCIYTEIKSIFLTESNVNNALYIAYCSLLSAVLACGFTQPPDVIRSYMQLNNKQSLNFISTSKHIYKKHGLQGFFLGFVPRSTRRILISVLGWTLYEKLTIKN
jgi:solute carrier family 25 protein 38